MALLSTTPQDVYIVVPGIMGSTLYVHGKPVWAPKLGQAADALRSLGANLKPLTLAVDSPDADDLGDGVTAEELFPDIHLIPGLEKIDGYTALRNAIKKHFNVIPNQNYFELPYDWRRDNRYPARKLKQLADQSLAKWRKQSGSDKPRLVLLCHSMGGLIARYFLEVLGGWRDTKALITFGTPYRGSVKALNFVSNGCSAGSISLPAVSELLRSFTAVYQLLPIYPCCFGATGPAVELTSYSGDIAYLDKARAQAALTFHDEIRDAAARNAQDPEYSANRYEFYPIVGIGEPTLTTAEIKYGTLKAFEADGDEGGDGTVSRESASPPKGEPESSARYLHEFHGSLQNSPYSWWQLAGILKPPYRSPFEKKYYVWTEEQIREKALKDPAPTDVEVGLRVNDAYAANQSIELQVRRTEGLEAELRVIVETDDAKQSSSQSITAANAGEWYPVKLGAIPSGSYRVRVLARPQPTGFPSLGGMISDVFLVM